VIFQRPGTRVPLSLLWHTVRQLRPSQVINRVARRLPRRVPSAPAGLTLAPLEAPWVAPVPTAPHLVAPTRIRIHDHERDIGSAEAWSATDVSHLWLYHLHYFDELCAPPASDRTVWRRELVTRWIRENPPGVGTGWEPYPASLRVVNWIKWHLAGNALGEDGLHSLATQLSSIASRLEFHLLGNHLFENAKALCFGGRFLRGAAADRWWEKGHRLLEHELAEQILPDGGHFELSPMYHARMLENVLDLINLERAFGRRTTAPLQDHAQRMLEWLAVMTHPDGGIALFNDAALGQAPRLAELVAYAERLGLAPPPVPRCPLHWLAWSGYGRVTVGPWVGFLDVAEVGPSYLPAHGHADALTFELSLCGERFVVDTGTQTYEDGSARWQERSTAAHNTIEIDGQSSSEVWKAFRVGRRARVSAPVVEDLDGGCRVTGSHDGYARIGSGVLHKRTWEFRGSTISIADLLAGSGRHEVALRLHFHPSVRIELAGPNEFALLRSGRRIARFIGDPALAFEIEPASYHPTFGSSDSSLRLTGRASVELPASLLVTLIADQT
jgi:uncharacterized heparinase superfamily protein